MCNLYRMSSSRDEVAAFFDAVVGEGSNAPEEIFPGYPGLVVSQGAVRQMVWGFPLHRTGVKGQPLKPKPANNARTDKLRSPFWQASYKSRRCLIPVTVFAEMEGATGHKTRVWFAPPDESLFAVAGLWRDTEEWGPAYSMIMTDACVHVSQVHDRMPVVLPRDDWSDWLDGTPDDAHLLCRPYEKNIVSRREGEAKLL